MPDGERNPDVPWFIPDAHRYRAPIPYSHKEHEQWSHQRQRGKRRFVAEWTIISLIAFPLISAAICYAIYLIERPQIDGHLFRLAFPYIVLIVGGGPVLGYFLGTMIWHISEDRFHASQDADGDVDENLR
ncbi:hypothetical protein Enr13x_09340 [Stieleria neptunia]|uniref:Uncharacterized protein n=1 Tax=Stieleria neptunia TaxID=2527979 RepID=A0A518HJR6_9BACT|nr:hypothetical protein [Stieleria neptunia]QDV41096.1 hypothetical protein Enr13x_09340 [Stieleria neptunia]